MGLVGVIALAALSWLVLSDGAGPTAPPADATTVPPPPDGANGTTEQVDVADADLLRQLRQDGSARVRIDEQAVELSQAPAALGALVEPEKAFVREVLSTRIDVFAKDLERTLAREQWPSDEERDLAIAKAMLIDHRFKEYDQAFRDGQYFLLADGESPPELADRYTALNLAVTRAGEPVRLLVLIDKQTTQVGALESRVDRLRANWLRAKCREFNERPDAERRLMITRMRKNKRSDRTWRKRHFPKGTAVDKQANTIYVVAR